MVSPNATSNPDNPKGRNRASRLLGILAGISLVAGSASQSSGPEELRYEVTLFVWGRWLIFALCLVLLAYNPDYSIYTYTVYILFLVLLFAVNGYVHYRVLWGRAVTRLWMLVLCIMDVFLITGGMIADGDFDHYLFYLLYYPALAWFAVFFSSFKLTFAWVTMVAVIYAAVSLTLGEGLNTDLKDDKAVIARIAVMYAVVMAVNLISSSQRMKTREAVARERGLQNERVELSRTIHDTVAQSVYVVGLGIETARELARKTSDELAAKLDEAYTLSRTALWDLRHPIDSGSIFEGMGLGEALSSHARSFTAITSLPAEVIQTGDEGSLPPSYRGMLFGIVHNAMTNVLLHAQATRVKVHLDFQADQLCLTVSDDGIGMPRVGGGWGHGLRNMSTNAERMGGSLEVSPSAAGLGTAVTCVVPYRARLGGE